MYDDININEDTSIPSLPICTSGATTAVSMSGSTTKTKKKNNKRSYDDDSHRGDFYKRRNI